jgi:hypothetical protein
MTEVVLSSETPLYFYQTTRPHIEEDGIILKDILFLEEFKIIEASGSPNLYATLVRIPEMSAAFVRS